MDQVRSSHADGIEMLRLRESRVEEGEAASAYASLIGEASAFLDALARANPETEEMRRIGALLAEARRSLETRSVPEPERRFGRGRAHALGVQCMAPEVRTLSLDDHGFHGVTRIGDFFLGMNGAAHGGVVTLIFDEVLARVSAGSTRPPSRTAYLNTSFRSITPVNTDLSVYGHVERLEGRKRYLRGEIRHGGVTCAEAEALFVELRPGQP